jgi:transposase
MLEELGISPEDWEQTPAASRAAIAFLWQQNRMLQTRCAVYEHQVQRLTAEVERLKKLEIEVAELRERLGRNSQNSSKPPSSDPPFVSRPNQREKGKANRGGQPGHKGKRRQLLPVDEVDQVIDLRPVDCSQCGQLLLGEDAAPVRRQISELPPVRAVVTEYRSHRLKCSACGKVTRADWPAELPAGDFGPRLAAVVGYLSGRLNLSHRDVVEALGALYGVELGLGSVTALQKQVSEALAGVVETARQFVKQQPVHYVDETSWQEQARMQWMWVNSTPEVTCFRILPGRGRNQAMEVIGRPTKGIVTTDRLNAYHWLGTKRRQICWAHLKRDFQAMSERTGASAQLGQELLEKTREVFVLWGQFREGALSRRQFQNRMQPIKAEVGRLLRQGAECEESKTSAVCRQILQWEGSLWTYVRTPQAEPTNNQAERSLRRGVLWRKKSFGTQSEEGTRFVERILTVVTTLRQQKRDVLDFLTTACRNSAGLAQPLCLLPEIPSM